ncbi:hypothetical protein O1M63_02235 [Streptomyces mirabilis]|nr:hypothetical protein [Streptomyces mirabilis]
MPAAAAALQGLHYIPQLSGPEGTSIGPTYVGVATGVFLTAVRSTPRTATLVVAVLIPAAAVTESLLAPAGYRVTTLLIETVLLVAAWALGRLLQGRAPPSGTRRWNGPLRSSANRSPTRAPP